MFATFKSAAIFALVALNMLVNATAIPRATASQCNTGTTELCCASLGAASSLIPGLGDFGGLLDPTTIVGSGCKVLELGSSCTAISACCVTGLLGSTGLALNCL